ncbi:MULTISPECIES: NAD(P)-dependent oxidoreductase [unclassified Neorhizobium]|uniref:NAD(P)-dependent oxidoreductase n=1 Tax=unclassified Neorhizobium TaxID=2629175 RepID=UPI001FF3ED32|nr:MULTISPECIES: NAD(P)-dependent oxidoreductase [unclassified Neorhizobium]MCJ9669731.1 NAD(P)-dependent oxidoreductase [Neorhizobium sp. SHOUNA12B]MCJ9746067.1 NAD(P)-dependent oxidoreductase [Neorhizobium sp. SHOUNA12A]
MSVSVVGLGRIGTAVVPHLLILGEEVRVWNRSPAAVEKMVALGATPLNDVRDAFASELVLSILFDDAAVREVITHEAIASATGRETLHVCLSTLSPNLADELTLVHQTAGIGYLSAPLFGRPEAVEQKAANICVAGDPGLLEKARPYLESFGRVWALGNEPRQANVAKLCGNFLIGAAVAAMAETTGILKAEKADADAFMTLMTDTLFASPIYKSYAPSVTGARPLPASGLAMPIKDMGLLAAISAENQLSNRVLKALRESLSRAQDMGFGAEDWSTALGRPARMASAVA